MKEELKRFQEAGDALIAAWDEDRVEHYPGMELGSLDEVVLLIHNIAVAEREDALRHIIEREGLWDGDVDWVDGHTGVLWIGGPNLRLGIDYGLNAEWQVVLYWWKNEIGGDEGFAALTPYLEIDAKKATPREVFAEIKPLLRAVRTIARAELGTQFARGFVPEEMP